LIEPDLRVWSRKRVISLTMTLRWE